MDGRRPWRKPTLNVICGDLVSVGGGNDPTILETQPHDTYTPS